MRKLSILTCLLVGTLTSLWADNFGPTALTYSVEATPFSTELGNNFAYYHVNLDLGEFTRVAKSGNVNVSVEFQKGLELQETRFEKKPNGAIYYVTDFTTPSYKATVKDLGGNILLENTYGGFDKMIEFGKERSYSESDLAEKWLNEKDLYLRKLEFQHLDFTDLEVDLIDVLENTPIVVPAKNKAQPKRPVKVRLPTATPETSIESAEPELMTAENKPVKVESEPMETEIEATQSEAESMEKGAEPINVEAAKAEESVLKDPFGELNEPLADESLAKEGKSAPSAPVDYEENADKKNKKDRKDKEKKKKKKKEEEEDMEESITPVLSDRRNLVKLNLPNLSFGNITLNYERLLSPRNSVALNVGYIRPQSPLSTLNSFVNADEVGTSEFSGLTATLEYRIYGKKKGAGKGFYYAPYARYASHKLGFQSDIEGNFTNTNIQLSAIGLGAQIGVQWLIKDRVVIDWGIIGLAAQWYTFKSTFTAVDEPIDFDEIRADLERDFDDSVLSNKLEFTSDETSLQAKMPFLFGGMRTYLSVGYKF